MASDLSGPAVSRQEFDALFASLRTWGRWRPADRGAFNRVTAGHARRAAALVRSGTVVPTALPWNTRPGPDNPKPALHHMTDLGDVESPEPATHKDFLAADYHGKGVSHLAIRTACTRCWSCRRSPGCCPAPHGANRS
ncbi:hypothetical protein ABZ372_50745, partial [Streptomyces sp. NPDC005921]